MRRGRTILILAAAPLLLYGIAFGSEPRIKPGKWEFMTTTTMPMMPQPQTRTNTECITEEQADPLKEMTGDSSCTIKDKSVTGSTLKWKMSCKDPHGGAAMDGSGELTSQDNTVEGAMEMTMQMGGQSMTLKTAWKGKRLGDCD